MTSSSHVSAWSSITLLNIPCGKDLLFLDDDPANTVAAITVCPNARDNVVYRIDDVAVAIVTDRAMWTLRGVTHNRNLDVD